LTLTNRCPLDSVGSSSVSRITRSVRAVSFERLSQERADLFAHWKIGMTGVFS
jgi:hypothetical protein